MLNPGLSDERIWQLSFKSIKSKLVVIKIQIGAILGRCPFFLRMTVVGLGFDDPDFLVATPAKRPSPDSNFSKAAS